MNNDSYVAISKMYNLGYNKECIKNITVSYNNKEKYVYTNCEVRAVIENGNTKVIIINGAFNEKYYMEYKAIYNKIKFEDDIVVIESKNRYNQKVVIEIY